MSDMIRVTSGKYDDMVLYFTSNSLLADDKKIVFIRTIDECNNLFVRDLSSGEETQITYFTDTCPRRLRIHNSRQHDFNAIVISSVVLHSKTGVLYFVKGRKLYRYDLKGNGRALAALPEKTGMGCAHINEAGTKFIIGAVDDRCFDTYDGTNNLAIDDRIQELNLSSHLLVYDTDTGAQLLNEPVHNGRVTHVQFNPLDDNIIMYNHEWPADCGVRRIWVFDGKRHIQARTEGDGRSRDDWTCHEMWERTTGNLIYHGKYANGIGYIGRIVYNNFPDMHDYSIVEIPFPKEYVKYGHFTVSNTDLLVTDGYYQVEGEQSGTSAKSLSGISGEWITVLKPNWDKKTIEWIPLCKHESDWDSQESHPHPVFNHAANAVFFTSNRGGKRAVYSVKL